MTHVNKGRLVLGGIAAGVVQYVLEGIVNGVALSNDWKAWAEPLKSVIAFPSESHSMGIWALQSLMLGLVGVWMYTANRAKRGPGPKTAVCTGITLWLASWGSCFLNNMALGLVPCKINCANFAAGLPVAVASVVVGAWLYKD